MKAIIGCLCFLFSIANSKTVTKWIQTCDGIERRVIGERYIGTNIRGQIMCRFAPKDSASTLAFNFNALTLPKQGSVCPTIKLIGYTEMMKQTGLDEDDRIDPGRAIMIPADPENLITVSCQNYSEVVGRLVTAKKLGQKVQFEFSTLGTTQIQKNPFDITIFSFLTGVGMRCPDKHFRCWSDMYMCIDETLECDSEQNCSDNSDEDNFKCTGRIGSLTLGMFIVVVSVAVILIIGIIIGCIFYRRNQTKKKEKKIKQRSIVMEQTAHQPFIGDPTQPRQYFAAPPESEMSA